MEFKPKFAPQKSNLFDRENKFFEWKSRTPFPSEKDVFFHFISNSEMLKPLEAKFTLQQINLLNDFLPEWLYCVQYFGNRSLCERLSNELAALGIEAQDGWNAAMISSVIIYNEITLIADLIREFRFVIIKSDTNDIVYPMTPLHAWAIRQCADTFIKDFYPMAVDSGGIPFSNKEKCLKRAESILEMFPFNEKLKMSNILPYASIVPLHQK